MRRQRAKVTLSTRRGRSRMISASLNCSFKLSSRRLASRCFRSVCLVFIPIVFPSQSPSRDVESATLIGRRNRTYNTHMHAYVLWRRARAFVAELFETVAEQRFTKPRSVSLGLSRASLSPDPANSQSFRASRARKTKRQTGSFASPERRIRGTKWLYRESYDIIARNTLSLNCATFSFRASRDSHNRVGLEANAGTTDD